MWLSGNVKASLPGYLGLKPHWMYWAFNGAVLGQDTSEPQPSTSETQERHEKCELLS